MSSPLPTVDTALRLGNVENEEDDGAVAPTMLRGTPSSNELAASCRGMKAYRRLQRTGKQRCIRTRMFSSGGPRGLAIGRPTPKPHPSRHGSRNMSRCLRDGCATRPSFPNEEHLQWIADVPANLLR